MARKISALKLHFQETLPNYIWRRLRKIQPGVGKLRCSHLLLLWLWSNNEPVGTWDGEQSSTDWVTEIFGCRESPKLYYVRSCLQLLVRSAWRLLRVTLHRYPWVPKAGPMASQSPSHERQDQAPCYALSHNSGHFLHVSGCSTPPPSSDPIPFCCKGCKIQDKNCGLEDSIRRLLGLKESKDPMEPRGNIAMIPN